MTDSKDLNMFTVTKEELEEIERKRLEQERLGCQNLLDTVVALERGQPVPNEQLLVAANFLMTGGKEKKLFIQRCVG